MENALWLIGSALALRAFTHLMDFIFGMRAESERAALAQRLAEGQERIADGQQRMVDHQAEHNRDYRALVEHETGRPISTLSDAEILKIVRDGEPHD